PSNFPVRAGFKVIGDAKNWEKLGSCALAKPASTKQIVRVVRVFFISAFVFSLVSRAGKIQSRHNLDKRLSLREIALLFDLKPGRIRTGKVQQIHDPGKW